MSKVFAKDQGQDFGRWPDATSRLMYHHVMPVLLSEVNSSRGVIDLGGANGLLREFVDSEVLTVDIDPTKGPDIVADARTWEPARTPTAAGLVVMRYLLHYLTDNDARALFQHVRSWHRGTLLVIQFANEWPDMKAKRASSLNETAVFRTPEAIEALFGPWRVKDRKRIDYTVRREFYINRLGNPAGQEHGESVFGWTLEP
jgi:hypothetical protein